MRSSVKSKMDFVLYEGREQVAATAQKLTQGDPGSLQYGYPGQQHDECPAAPSRCRPYLTAAVKAGQTGEQKNGGQAYANDDSSTAVRPPVCLKKPMPTRAGGPGRGRCFPLQQVYAEYAKAL